MASPTTPAEVCEALDGLLALPRAQQHAASLKLAAEVDLGQPPEAWNTTFGTGSLFEAWTGSSLMSAVYETTAATLLPKLAPGWRGLEIGAGDGRFWRCLGPQLPPGTLCVVDPWPEVGERLAAVLPSQVALDFREGRVEEADLPSTDFALASLVLHHVGGADAEERRAFGLTGPGKRELLEALAEAVGPQGLVVLNEADVHCDLELSPGDPVLRDRFVDAYVRRCARALCADIRDGLGDPLRLAAVVRQWCLEEVRMSEVPRSERDVYELDVPRWLALFQRAGLRVVRQGPADPWRLFHHYVLAPTP